MKEEPDFYKGLLIGKDYILEEYLGGGQDGEVWRAKKRSIYNKDCCLKFLNSTKEKKRNVLIKK